MATIIKIGKNAIFLSYQANIIMIKKKNLPTFDTRLYQIGSILTIKIISVKERNGKKTKVNTCVNVEDVIVNES